MSGSRPTRFEAVDDAVAAVLRDKTEGERLAIADGLWRMARRLVREAVLSDHPDWAEPQVARETARRMSHGAV